MLSEHTSGSPMMDKSTIKSIDKKSGDNMLSTTMPTTTKSSTSTPGKHATQSAQDQKQATIYPELAVTSKLKSSASSEASQATSQTVTAGPALSSQQIAALEHSSSAVATSRVLSTAGILFGNVSTSKTVEAQTEETTVLNDQTGQEAASNTITPPIARTPKLRLLNSRKPNTASVSTASEPKLKLLNTRRPSNKSHKTFEVAGPSSGTTSDQAARPKSFKIRLRRSAQPQVCHFLNLPAEMREMVYKFHSQDYPAILSKTGAWLTDSPLIVANAQIKCEYENLMLKEAPIYIQIRNWDFSKAITFLNKMPSQELRKFLPKNGFAAERTLTFGLTFGVPEKKHFDEFAQDGKLERWIRRAADSSKAGSEIDFMYHCGTLDLEASMPLGLGHTAAVLRDAYAGNGSRSDQEIVKIEIALKKANRAFVLEQIKEMEKERAAEKAMLEQEESDDGETDDVETDDEGTDDEETDDDGDGDDDE